MSEVTTKTLLEHLMIVKKKLLEIDPIIGDFSHTGNLLIELYETSAELEKRLIGGSWNI